MFRGLSTGVRARLVLESVTSVLTAGLAILTLISREWIEALTGTDPDGGSGALEWVLVVVLALVAVACALIARADLRRAQRGASIAPTSA